MNAKFRLTLKGTNLADMAKAALARADTLQQADWSVEDCEVWGEDDVISEASNVVVVTATFTLTANVEIS